VQRLVSHCKGIWVRNMERFRLLGTLALVTLLSSDVVLIGLGGGLGSVARYLVGKLIHEGSGENVFPIGTLVVNVLGCFFLGMLIGVFLEQGSHRVTGWLNFLGTGFCGGFTTFSALQWETVRLIHDGRWVVAAVNVGLSIFAGLVGIVVGYLIGRWVSFYVD